MRIWHISVIFVKNGEIPEKCHQHSWILDNLEKISDTLKIKLWKCEIVWRNLASIQPRTSRSKFVWFSHIYPAQRFNFHIGTTPLRSTFAEALRNDVGNQPGARPQICECINAHLRPSRQAAHQLQLHVGGSNTERLQWNGASGGVHLLDTV